MIFKVTEYLPGENYIESITVEYDTERMLRRVDYGTWRECSKDRIDEAKRKYERR